MRKPPPPRAEDWHVKKTNCDICHKKRSTGNHEECSRIRKRKFAEENKD